MSPVPREEFADHKARVKALAKQMRQTKEIMRKQRLTYLPGKEITMKTLSREEYNEKVHFPAVRKWTEGMLQGEDEWEDWRKDTGIKCCSFCLFFGNTNQICPIKAAKCNGHECSIQFDAVNDTNDYPTYQKAAAAMLKHVISCDYDYYLSLIYEKEKPKEPKKQPLYMDRLYSCGDNIFEVTRYLYGSEDCEIKNVITGREDSNIITRLLTPATKEQIMDAYGFRVGDEKVVWYEDSHGDIILDYPGSVPLRAVTKALLEAAKLKYISYKHWKQMKGE